MSLTCGGVRLHLALPHSFLSCVSQGLGLGEEALGALFGVFKTRQGAGFLLTDEDSPFEPCDVSPLQSVRMSLPVSHVLVTSCTMSYTQSCVLPRTGIIFFLSYCS